jgi:hypothetical protein
MIWLLMALSGLSGVCLGLAAQGRRRSYEYDPALQYPLLCIQPYNDEAQEIEMQLVSSGATIRRWTARWRGDTSDLLLILLRRPGVRLVKIEAMNNDGLCLIETLSHPRA